MTLSEEAASAHLTGRQELFACSSLGNQKFVLQIENMILRPKGALQ